MTRETVSDKSGRIAVLFTVIAFVLLAIWFSGCASSPTQPTSFHTPPLPDVWIAYDINVPSPIIAQVENTTFPNGVKMPPAQAQSSFDYRPDYGGTANVYYGPIGPPAWLYTGVGIVIAPTAVSVLEDFPSAMWTGGCGPTPAMCHWIGRFTYAAVGQVHHD